MFRRVATLALGGALVHCSPALGVALAYGVFACSNSPIDEGVGGAGSTGGAQGAGGSALMLRGRCEVEARLGGFELVLEQDFSAFSGSVYDRVARSADYEQVGSDEACSLVKKTFPSCDPPCRGSKTCVQGGSCETPPMSLDLGAVIVHGLTTPLTMHPVRPGSRYFSTELPHPPVAPSRPVRLQAEGGVLGVLQLRSEGVAPLETDADGWRLERGKALEIAWKAPRTPTLAKVRVTLNVDQHGSTPVTLTCRADDAGTLSISSGIIDKLLDFGISGFATGNIYREASDQLDVDAGCIDLAIVAHSKRSLEVSGHQACTKDADCDGGKTCDVPNDTCH
jgi:hypothetical protein